jgi:UDP-N-acetylmuramate dehydrogenase
MEIKTVQLKDYTSLRIGGEGKIVHVYSLKKMVEAVMYAKTEGFRVHILGSGTNTFFGENMNTILCIKNEIKGISFEDQGDFVLVTASSGELFDDVVSFATSKNLWGIENLSSIPGSVGAAPVQNIGAYGVELADVFVSLSALDLKTLQVVEIDKHACAFEYRNSLFKQQKNSYSILSITLKLYKLANPVLTYKPLDTLLSKVGLCSEDVRTLVIATRKEKLPDWKAYPNAGSFFKNPVVQSAQGEALRTLYPDVPLIIHQDGFKIPAAWLIEHVAHMKGKRIGDIGSWPHQPLVLVNYETVEPRQIMSFSGEIISKIVEKTGIILEREVNYIDDDTF